MRPTFLAFETCKRGLAVTQKSKDIIGNNIINASTDGYTRQRVDVVSVAPNSTATRFGTSKASLAGMGVEMTGVSQVRDSYLDKRFRQEYGDSTYFNQSATILNDINTALREYGPEGTTGALVDAIQTLTTALQGASSRPSDASQANLVSVAAKNMCELLHELSSKLENVGDQAKFDMETSVTDYNTKTARLAELNKIIGDNIATYGDPCYYGPSELLDERNMILDDLAGYGDIDVKEEEHGRITLTVGGHVVVNGKKNEEADIMNMTYKNDGTVELTWNNNAKDATPLAGSLKAYKDYINGRGPNMQNKNETLERGVRYYQDKLDTFARTFAKVMNGIVPFSQTDDKGAVTPTDKYKELFGARVPKVENGKVVEGEYISTTDSPVTAANISLSDGWLKDSNYVMFSKENGDSKYYLEMKDFLNGETKASFVSTGETFEGTFNQYVLDYAEALGADISYNQGRQSATASIANQLLQRRDDVSGVSTNEETQTMMVYDKAYQAIARVLTSMDEALDVLINKTGLVGR